jgi:hypothetical protein
MHYSLQKTYSNSNPLEPCAVNKLTPYHFRLPVPMAMKAFFSIRSMMFTNCCNFIEALRRVSSHKNQ